MKGLITDRTQYNVFRRALLSAKGKQGMTSAEMAEWLGDPMATTDANLLPNGPYYSSAVGLKYKNNEIVATANAAGVYLYAISIIGEAVKYENKTFTLSIENLIATTGAIPQLAVYWHDDNGYEYAGASILGAGSVTFNTANFPNTNGRANLALYVYVTTSASVVAGATARFVGVMLNNGATKSKYVPYTEVVATDCTKGAYNYSDLNRVERAVEEISDLVGLGLTTKTDWIMWDVPTATEMARYINNVRAIKDHFGIDIELPTTMNNFTYESANNIEKILLDGYAAATGGS